MPYPFSPLIDPEHYLKASEPPPFPWKTLDMSDPDKARREHPRLVADCEAWERGELIRLAEIVAKRG